MPHLVIKVLVLNTKGLTVKKINIEISNKICETYIEPINIAKHK